MLSFNKSLMKIDRILFTISKDFTVLFIIYHHHIVLVARISLTLSRHSSLSFIALGRSSGQHPVMPMTVLLANVPAQAEILLHGLEWAAVGIGLHVNAHKTEYMCFNQIANITTLNVSSLKLVDKLTYLRSRVSSTKTDINMQLAKAWTTINRLSVIWKSDLADKIKRSFFQAAVVSTLLYGCTTWTLTKQMEKSLTATT